MKVSETDQQVIERAEEIVVLLVAFICELKTAAQERYREPAKLIVISEYREKEPDACT